MMHFVVAQLLSRIWLWNCMDCSMLGFPFTISWVCSNLFFADYRASPSSAAKNIINLILVFTIWWYPCVELSLMLVEKTAMTSVFSWQNSCYPMPCFVSYSKAKLACYSKCLLTSYFCISIPYDEKDIFFRCSRRCCMCSPHQSVSTSSASVVCP